MAGKPKRTAFSKLLNAMKKMSMEVNDNEICRRLETLMLTSKEDLNMSIVKSLFANPLEFDPKNVPEPYTQYIRHFIYMAKRNYKLGMDPNLSVASDKPTSKKAKVAKKAKKAAPKKKS